MCDLRFICTRLEVRVLSHEKHHIAKTETWNSAETRSFHRLFRCKALAIAKNSAILIFAFAFRFAV